MSMSALIACIASERFYFDQISNIHDFGVRNPANLFTNQSGTINVTSVGDPVVAWRGELGKVFISAISLSPESNFYEFSSEGVRDQKTGSGATPYDGTLGATRPESSACSVFMVFDIAPGKGKESFPGFDVRSGGTDTGFGFSSSPTGSTISTSSRGTLVSGTPFPTTWPGRHCAGLVYNGTSTWVWMDSTKTTRTPGTESDTLDSVRLYSAGADRDVTILAWGIVFGAISDDEWSKIQALALTL